MAARASDGAVLALEDEPNVACLATSTVEGFQLWVMWQHLFAALWLHRPVPAFDHHKTLFALDRRHAAVKCTQCHDVQRAARLDPNCRTCHGDPHRGRAQLDCADCHRADVWNLVRCDHDRTEFPLRGRHFTRPCRDCHVDDQFTGVRPECVSCHRADRQRADSSHMDHRGFSFHCGGCHRTFNW